MLQVHLFSGVSMTAVVFPKMLQNRHVSIKYRILSSVFMGFTVSNIYSTYGAWCIRRYEAFGWVKNGLSCLITDY